MNRVTRFSVLAIVMITGIMGRRADAQAPTEISSGTSFLASYNCVEENRGNLYSWAAINPQWPFHMLGLSILIKGESGTCRGIGRCAPYYISSDGGKSWPCQAIQIPGTETAFGFFNIADPTCSFDNQQGSPTSAYATWLFYEHGIGTPPAWPRSRVYALRLPSATPGQLNCTWDPPLQPVHPPVFDPPGPVSSGYQVDKPFIAIDQTITSQFINRMYVGTVYWVLPSPQNPNDWIPGNYIFCRTGTSSPPGNPAWATSWTVPPVSPPSGPGQPFSTPGGVLVSDYPPPPQGQELDAPYVAVAPAPWLDTGTVPPTPKAVVYIAWIDIIGGIPNTTGVLYIDRSVDGGATWGLQANGQHPDRVIRNIPALQQNLWANSGSGSCPSV